MSETKDSDPSAGFDSEMWKQGVAAASHPDARLSDRSRLLPTKPNGESVSVWFEQSFEAGFEWAWGKR